MKLKAPFAVLKTKHVWNLYGLRIGIDPWGYFRQHALVQVILYNHLGTFDGDWHF
jgi:hypothetical protein